MFVWFVIWIGYGKKMMFVVFLLEYVDLMVCGIYYECEWYFENFGDFECIGLYGKWWMYEVDDWCYVEICVGQVVGQCVENFDVFGGQFDFFFCFV